MKSSDEELKPEACNWSAQVQDPSFLKKKKKTMYRTQDGKSTTLTIEPNLGYFQFKELE